MKLTLMIEGSPAVIAAVLAALPGGATVLANEPELPLMPVAGDTITVAGVQGEYLVTDADNAPADPGAPLVDSAGVSWDERIHASSKATVTDGTWRMKRGVDKAVVDAIMPELLGQQPVAITPPMPVMPVMPTEPMPMPVAEPVVAAPVTAGAITIPEFMQHLSVQMTGPDAKITNEYLAEAVGKFNAAYGTTFITVNDFFTAPDKLPALVQMITLDGRW